MKLRLALLVLVLSVPALAEAQVDCTKDQLNPACVSYVLKHSVAEVPSLGKWPQPPLEPLPLTPIRPAIVALIFTLVVTQPTPSFNPYISQQGQAIETTTPAPSPTTSDCDAMCQQHKRDVEQLGAGAGTLAAVLISLAIQDHRNKKFCAEHPNACINGHPMVGGSQATSSPKIARQPRIPAFEKQTPTSVYAKNEAKNSETQPRISALEPQTPTSVYVMDEPKNRETQCRSLAETYYLVGPDEMLVDGKVCKKETVPVLPLVSP